MQTYFSSIKSRPSLIELPGSLDLEHKIPAIDVLHHKEESEKVGCRSEVTEAGCQALPVLRLEAGIETRQEWMVRCQGKDSLFRHCAFYIIILNDDIFFQHLELFRR